MGIVNHNILPHCSVTFPFPFPIGVSYIISICIVCILHARDGHRLSEQTKFF